MAEADFRQWDFYPHSGLNADSTALSLEGSLARAGIGSETADEACCYQNAATCPDCGAGMVRLGTCFSCPVCGWGSCC